MDHHDPHERTPAAATALERDRLRQLIALLDRYDLSAGSCADTSDLRQQLGQLTPPAP